MSDVTKNSFNLKNILFPKIESIFISKPTPDSFEQLFRIEGVITDPKTLRLLFGVKLISHAKMENGTPLVQVIVESIGDFVFEKDLPTISKATDIPLVGNMLALMYPFIREKINYCLSNNQLVLFLPPINTINLVHENQEVFKITDTRVDRAIPSE